MADLLVNHTYNSLAQGVSEQATEARHETQVEEMENCIPHVSRGVLRRNPVNFITDIRDKDGLLLAPADYYIYSYDRGTAGEQYVLLLGHRKWYMYDTTGVLKGSYNDAVNVGTNLDYLDTNGKHPKEVFSLVTVGDHTWVSNNQITTAMSTLTDGTSENDHKKIAIHIIKSTGNVVTKTVNVTAGDTVTATPTLEGYNYKFNAYYNDDTYVTTSDTASVTSGNTYLTGSEVAARMVELLNVGHFATSTELTYSSAVYSRFKTFSAFYFASTSNAYVRLSGGKYYFYWQGNYKGVSSTGTLVVGSYTYALSGSAKAIDFQGTYYAIKRGSYKTISGDPLDSLWASEGPLIYRKDMPESSTIEYSDSFGNTASYGFKGVVPSSDKLPDTLPKAIGEVIVKVDASDDATGGEYWLKWDGEAWSETRAPGLSNILDHTTMPHEFVRAADGTFTFGFYGEFDGTIEGLVPFRANTSEWAERIKGDLDSAPEPSFIGKKISDMFLHNNRLGLLAEDSVVLSELSEYKNFFPTTVRSIPDTDPIDLIVATTDVTGLKKAVSLSGTLLLFSDKAQFSLTGGGEALTPESATISAVSSYNYSSTAPAKVLGNKVLFTTESGNGTQLFSMSTESVVGGASNVSADNASLHIPTYLPTGMNYIVTHSILGYMFMSSPLEPNTIYVLNTLDVNNQNAQSAFHKWTFAYPLLGMSVLNNDLLLMFNVGGTLTGASISLDIPTDVSAVTYSDEFADTVLTDYDSFITMSKWFIKDGNGFGNKRGRLQIRTALFSVGDFDKYKIEVFNDSLLNPAPTEELWVLSGALWDDAAYWSFNATDTSDSSVIWRDALPYFSRVYHNDKKVTIASNSETTFIRFGSSDLEPQKGFTLSTVNLEGLFRQRSQRL